jgi:uncharacterized protein
MLSHTFLHLPGVGTRRERHFWHSGISCWDQLTGPLAQQILSPGQQEAYGQKLAESKSHLQNKNAHYFAGLLKASEHWRLFNDFKDQAAYLDIETTGLGGVGDHITTIALYANGQIRHYVYGRNLDDFPNEAAAYKIWITYNGKTFDVPFLERQFKAKFTPVQIDLRYVLHSLGIKGGLKSCEHQLGINRHELEGVDGYFAVLLWREYKHAKNEKALETLLEIGRAHV